MNSQVFLWCLKLVLGGIVSFLSILLWSKSRSFCWICLISSVLISYAGIIYEMMVQFGVFSLSNFLFLGIPIVTLCFTIIPYIFLIIALILIIKDLS